MTAASNNLIIRPFNSVFCTVLAGFIIILVVASLALKKKSDRTKRIILASVCLVTFIGFFVYKYYLGIDAEYNVIRTEMGMGGFNWWGELPLHLCNINMMLIPVAVLTKSKPLQSFCFFLAPLGAFMALAMPGEGFDGFSILLPRMLGYYGTHFMIVIEGIAIVTFGLYKPTFRDIPRTILTAFITTLCIFAINMAMRLSGLYANANYFYSVETEGNFLLNIFYSWIPVPFLYLMPCGLILAVYMYFITAFFEMPGIIRRRQKKD